MDSWTPENPGAKFPRLATSPSFNGGNNFNVSSDFWYHNAAYFRMKSLQIGYDFKKVLLKNFDVLSSLKVSLVGTNLFTISSVNDYYDPELNANNGYAYPTQKTYSVVVNIGF